MLNFINECEILRQVIEAGQFACSWFFMSGSCGRTGDREQRVKRSLIRVLSSGKKNKKKQDKRFDATSESETEAEQAKSRRNSRTRKRAQSGKSDTEESDNSPSPSSAPQGESYLPVGTSVEARFRGKSKWRPATVVKVISHRYGVNTYDLEYDDGESELGVKRSLIRLKKTKSESPQQEAPKRVSSPESVASAKAESPPKDEVLLVNTDDHEKLRAIATDASKNLLENLRSFDYSRRGRLTFAELEEALLQSGVHLSDIVVENLCSCFDFECKGEVSYNSFVTYAKRNRSVASANLLDRLRKQYRKYETNSQVARLFRQNDRSSTGKIDAGNFFDALKEQKILLDQDEETTLLEIFGESANIMRDNADENTNSKSSSSSSSDGEESKTSDTRSKKSPKKHSKSKIRRSSSSKSGDSILVNYKEFSHAMKPDVRQAMKKFRQICQTLLDAHDVNLFDVIIAEDQYGRASVRSSFFKQLLRSSGMPFLSDDIFVLCERYQDERRQVRYVDLFNAVGLGDMANGAVHTTPFADLRRSGAAAGYADARTYETEPAVEQRRAYSSSRPRPVGKDRSRRMQKKSARRRRLSSAASNDDITSDEPMSDIASKSEAKKSKKKRQSEEKRKSKQKEQQKEKEEKIQKEKRERQKKRKHKEVKDIKPKKNHKTTIVAMDARVKKDAVFLVNGIRIRAPKNMKKNEKIKVQLPKDFVFDEKDLPDEPEEPSSEDDDSDDDVDEEEEEEEADEDEERLMVELITDMFHVADLDGDEHMDLAEFEHAIRAMGCDPTKSELKKIYNKWDYNKNGTIDREEFNQFVTTEILGGRSVMIAKLLGIPMRTIKNKVVSFFVLHPHFLNPNFVMLVL